MSERSGRTDGTSERSERTDGTSERSERTDGTSERSERTDGTGEGADATPTRPRPEERRCPACGAADLQPGYLEDTGEHSKGFVRWVAGPLVRRRRGRADAASGAPRWVADALRCPICSHVSLWATRQV